MRPPVQFIIITNAAVEEDVETIRVVSEYNDVRIMKLSAKFARIMHVHIGGKSNNLLPFSAPRYETTHEFVPQSCVGTFGFVLNNANNKGFFCFCCFQLAIRQQMQKPNEIPSRTTQFNVLWGHQGEPLNSAMPSRLFSNS